MNKETLILILLILQLQFLIYMECCPTKCNCDYEKMTTECSSSNITNDQLLGIVKDIPSNTTQLKFDGNTLTEFPAHIFANLTNLKKIHLGKNKIEVLPSKLSHFFPKLTNVYLDSNKITHLRKEDFIGYENVLVLDLYNNQITELTSELFTQAKLLVSLYLESNKISRISNSAFAGLYNLNNLYLNENLISNIDKGTFDNNPLIDLDISHNQLTTIPSYFVTTKILVSELKLNSNNIRTIHKNAFSNLLLDKVFLQNNNITVLTKEMFWNSSLRKQLNISGNYLTCNCDMYEFLKSIIVESMLGECSFPPVLNGQDINTFIKNNNLSCTPCSTRPCRNDASCKLIHAGHFRCECEKGYFGDLCQFTDRCYKNPCKHNGTCSLSNSTSEFLCKCGGGYEGDVCEKEIPCFKNYCQNGGSCERTNVMEYKCICRKQYYGKNCENFQVKEGKEKSFHPGWIVLIGALVLILAIVVGVIILKARRDSRREDVCDKTPLHETKRNIVSVE